MEITTKGILDRIYNFIASGEKFETFKDFPEAEKSYESAKQQIGLLRDNISTDQTALLPVLDNFYTTVKAKQDKVALLIAISEKKQKSKKPDKAKEISEQEFANKLEALIAEVEIHLKELTEIKCNESNITMQSFVFTNEKNSFIEKIEEVYRKIYQKLIHIKEIMGQEKLLEEKKEKYKGEFDTLKKNYDTLKFKYFRLKKHDTSMFKTKLSNK
jgi:hypothetical protein